VKTFEYTAANAAGALVSGHALATDELELDGDLEASGLVLTRAVEVSRSPRARGARISRGELVNLSSQLATLTGAGVPLVGGLEGIARRSSSPDVRALVELMIVRLQAGESLSEAMDAHPRCFPDVFRASVRAGEASGSLGHTLARTTRHLEWVQGMRATTAQALIYPAVLLVAIAGLIGILLYHVLPKIIALFPGGVAELPRETRIVMAASELVTSNATVLGVGLVLGAIAFVFAQRAPALRAAAHRALLAVPTLGPLAAKIATSKFAATAATLHSAGCDVFTTLRVAGETCGNAAMHAAFLRATDGVSAGLPISEALAREPLCDSLLVQMISVGESSGRLGETLEHISAHYDQDVPRSVKRMLAVFEPAVLVGAGVLVAFILLAALLPIFDMYDRLG
jgi:type II secretory pathway component PulF